MWPLVRLFCGRTALHAAPDQARWPTLKASLHEWVEFTCWNAQLGFSLQQVYSSVFTREFTNSLIFISYGCLHNLISPCLVCTLHFRLIMARVCLQSSVWAVVLFTFYFQRPILSSIFFSCDICSRSWDWVLFLFKIMIVLMLQFIMWVIIIWEASHE